MKAKITLEDITFEEDLPGNVSLDEIVPGIVLFLDPQILIANGVSYPEAFSNIQLEQLVSHLALCMEVDDNESKWLCLSSSEFSNSRKLKGFKSGHWKWVNNDSYFSPNQTFRATNEAIILAAEGDLSTKNFRNRLVVAGTKEIANAIK